MAAELLFQIVSFLALSGFLDALIESWLVIRDTIEMFKNFFLAGQFIGLAGSSGPSKSTTHWLLCLIGCFDGSRTALNIGVERSRRGRVDDLSLCLGHFCFSAWIKSLRCQAMSFESVFSDRLSQGFQMAGAVHLIRSDKAGTEISTAFIPYDDVAKGAPAGTFTSIQDRSVMVAENQVLPASGDNIDYAYLAIAIVSSQPLPVQLASTEHNEACHVPRDIQQTIKEGQKIAVTGGGAVGFELASDIKDFYPDKEVIQIHSRGQLMSHLASHLGTTA
ncbi:Apoptosis-inducing factor 2 [Aspergillus tanneri]|uniref:Apoptosis-inducing factor 2 n=1 Tax=Aspergillus tanneri TaxID=1220188 RepID=A0A5M9N5T5_9EURO|nr:Apoptosis-inducing factor 2 [Aspergillus tanneri]KAA8652429.1 Apoptosis-inducing factor 2 [Aspergillus tanneri]